MKINKFFVLNSLILFGLTCQISCKSDPVESEISKASTPNFEALRSDFINSKTQSINFAVESGIDFTSAKGARVQIGSDCINDANNNAVKGQVTLTFIELYDRGEMVMANKPLMGVNEQGELLPLITGGQYYLNVKKGEQNLKPGCSFHVEIPSKYTGGIDQGMLLWKGLIGSEGNLVWFDIFDPKVNPDQGEEVPRFEEGIAAVEDDTNVYGNYYDILSAYFGWTNVDRFYFSNGSKTKIQVKVPEGYDQRNSAVYLMYEDQPNSLAQLDFYDVKGMFFTEHYGFVPIGLKVNIVFVSESDKKVAYSIKEVQVTNGAIYEIFKGDLKTIDTEGLIKKINGLK